MTVGDSDDGGGDGGDDSEIGEGCGDGDSGRWGNNDACDCGGIRMKGDAIVGVMKFAVVMVMVGER